MIYGATRFYRNANTFKIPPPEARSKIHDKPDAQKVNVKGQKFPQGDGYDFGNPDDFIVLHNHTNGYFEIYVTKKYLAPPLRLFGHLTILANTRFFIVTKKH